jgi:hypothetical protein
VANSASAAAGRTGSRGPSAVAVVLDFMHPLRPSKVAARQVTMVTGEGSSAGIGREDCSSQQDAVGRGHRGRAGEAMALLHGRACGRAKNAHCER